ncbi:odorant receptor 30a-like [Osmia bicornis bicornis]|uniref:odorant receptor 30a-like n=1 Tax=Osmia bicornis bicornis TaxID=1437191 RepID=UPI001EAE884D|nr:odorant receptor 30a-like [Osmia bicornis bicornis]
MEEETTTEDLSIQATGILLKFAATWLTNNNVEERCRRLWLLFIASSYIISTSVNMADLYHSWGDINQCVFVGINVACTILAICKLTLINYHRKNFVEIILYAKRNFWHCNYDSQELVYVTECRFKCTLWMIFIYALVTGCTVSYGVLPFARTIGTNESERTLPFTMYVDLHLTETPYYQLMFAYQLLCANLIAIGYISTDACLCILNMHTACQFRILQHRLLSLWDFVNEKMDIVEYTHHCNDELRCCVHQHQLLIDYCAKLENVYTIMIAAHLLFCSILFSFDFYEILLADISVVQVVSAILNLMGTFIPVVMFTYSCHGLVEESEKIVMATYSGLWTTLPMNKVGKSLRENIRIIMLRSLRPCCLTAAGFFPVTMETTTAIISTTLSYFTLIKETTT